MLHVFPITLAGVAKRWVDRLSPGTVDSWDLLKKAFIQRNIDSSSNSKGIAAIVSKPDSLGRDMKKLKENVHAIQVGCQLCEGAHLDKECPLNEEVKSMEEVKYREFGRPFPNNSRNDGRFNRGVSGYDQPSSGERRPSLTEIINKYMEEAAKRHAEQDKWLKKFYQNMETNRETHDQIIQGLKTKLPLKEQDTRSFILPSSIRRLDFNNALADLGASINIMPLSMYKRLGMGKIKPINMVIEMADNTKCTPKGIVENLLVKINKFIFLVDFVILDMVEDFRMPIILGRPLLAISHAKRERIGDEEDDTEENLKDLEECEEDKANVIMGAIYDKLNDGWFNGTSEDEDDLEGILDYLEPKSYDGLIDLDYEAYNKRKCRLLRLTYTEPPLILIEKVKITRYTIGPKDIYTKVKVLGVDEMPRTRDNVAAIRVRLMEKMAKDGSDQAKT
ncbi:zinc knuckle CX2CX4HX4C containing protein [Tanacetum coccineum]